MGNLDFETIKRMTNSAAAKVQQAWKGKVFSSSTPMIQPKLFPEGDTFFAFAMPDATNNPVGYVSRLTHKVQCAANRDAEVWKCLGERDKCPIHEITDDIITPLIDPESEDYDENFFDQEDRKVLADLFMSNWIYALILLYNPVIESGSEKGADGKEYKRYTVGSLTNLEMAKALAAQEQYIPVILQSFAPNVNESIQQLFTLNPLINHPEHSTIVQFHKAHTQYTLTDTRQRAPMNLFTDKVKKYPKLVEMAYGKKVKELSAAAMKAALTSKDCWWFHRYGMSFDPAEPSIRDAASAAYCDMPKFGG